MSTINNALILSCHFNEIMKGPGISFQSLALSEKQVRNVYHTGDQYLT